MRRRTKFLPDVPDMGLTTNIILFLSGIFIYICVYICVLVLSDGGGWAEL